MRASSATRSSPVARPHARARATVLLGLDHDEVRVGERRDLCEVRHDEHLVLRGERLQARADRDAVAPPMPASISSKTSTGTVSACPSTPLSASITRETSPPDAMRASGRGVSPDAGA